MRWPTVSLTLLHLVVTAGHRDTDDEDETPTHRIGFITDIEEEQP